MTPAEAAVVLTVAASFDRRTVDESAAQAWAAALPEVAVEAARDAVVAHYREKRDWVMPADIRYFVRRARAKRLSEMPPVDPPPALAERSPRASIAWTRTVQERWLAGDPIDVAYRTACERVGVPVPIASTSARLIRSLTIGQEVPDE
ncbi:hypothetical protein [Nocardioides sp.]|uniref:hypothetical protein n=1 Tax=Nocardioides sp. TaxID=35761 RepID=UPI0039E5313C